MISFTISAIAELVSKQNTCECCGQEVRVTRGPGRVLELHGCATVRVPESLALLRCLGCGRSYPTEQQLSELLVVADQDWLGDGGRCGRPVHRGT
jgi:hypothetical protein